MGNSSLHSHLDYIEAVDKRHKQAIDNARRTRSKLDDPNIVMKKIDDRTWKYWNKKENKWI